MRASALSLSTHKETPAHAESISHQLLLRAGMIHQLASGLYTWLPLGLRVLRKVEALVHKHMKDTGAQELLMPMVQPAELWQQSERWQQYGPELLRLQDRHQRDFCLGPTHEEVITHLASLQLKSYKQLPVTFYQIQTKFRDEVRPRFGLMRAREFLMKDAYSFHVNQESLQQTYDTMYQAYHHLFNELTLTFCAVEADSGAIGGQHSHEFHVLADSGEDAIAFSDQSAFAANIEKTSVLPPSTAMSHDTQALTAFHTPSLNSLEALATYAEKPLSEVLQTQLVLGINTDNAGTPPLIALITRADHQLNTVKAEQLPHVASPLTFANEEQIRQATGCPSNALGPGLSLTTYVDQDAAHIHDAVCGANQADTYYRGFNWARDNSHPYEVVDLRNIEAGDPSPDGKGTIVIKRGIEVGHIFQLGDKYAKAMGAHVLNEQGKQHTLTMGCYGIGVSRIVAATIEQNHDAHGIQWPDVIAPFYAVIIGLNMQKSPAVSDAATALYQQCLEAGLDVLLDDRDERPGIKFADMELIGIPHQIIVGERGLADGTVEYKNRRTSDTTVISLDAVIPTLTA